MFDSSYLMLIHFKNLKKKKLNMSSRETIPRLLNHHRGFKYYSNPIFNSNKFNIKN